MRSPNAVLFPVKRIIRPSAHSDLCLATIPPSGLLGGWDRSIWEELAPSATRGEPDRRRVPAAQKSHDERHCRGGSAWACSPLLCRPTGPSRSVRGAAHAAPRRDGSAAAGVPGWRRRSYGRRFTSPTVNVLERCRKPLATRVSFIRLMRHNVPVECGAEPCGVTRKTAFEWRRRALATVPATRTGSCCATPSGLTSSASTTLTSPRATGTPASAACPARSSASAAPSTCTRTRPRSSAATASPARHA